MPPERNIFCNKILLFYTKKVVFKSNKIIHFEFSLNRILCWWTVAGINKKNTCPSYNFVCISPSLSLRWTVPYEAASIRNSKNRPYVPWNRVRITYFSSRPYFTQNRDRW